MVLIEVRFIFTEALVDVLQFYLSVGESFLVIKFFLLLLFFGANQPLCHWSFILVVLFAFDSDLVVLNHVDDLLDLFQRQHDAAGVGVFDALFKLVKQLLRRVVSNAPQKQLEDSKLSFIGDCSHC